MAGTKEHLRIMSLCSGIGGLDLGLSRAVPGSRVVCHVEREAYAAAVLMARMEDSSLEPAPVWCGDLGVFDARPWAGAVDCVTAGYPCQPFSTAGKRGGEDDPRHLWPHVARVVRECAAPLVFVENVPGHLSLGFDAVCRELQDMGYRIAAGVFSAAEVGASHRRERLFCLAYRDQRMPGRDDGAGDVGDTYEQGLEGRSGPLGGGSHELPAWPPSPSSHAEWSWVIHHYPFLAPAVSVADADGGEETPEPAVRRVADGLSHRMDRLRCLGNAVVPATAEKAFRVLAHEILNG